MIPAVFDYRRPRTVAAAVRLLQSHGPEAKILAGGQSLLPMMKLRVATPKLLVDIGRVASLRNVRLRQGVLRIGAMVTHHEIESSPVIRRVAPALAETAAVVGDLQVRNLGTIGGALVHADPVADYPATMLALDAGFTLQGPLGVRTVSAAEFFLGPMTTAAEPEEIMTEIVVPACPPRFGAAYLKMPNPASGFAIAGVAAAIGLDQAGRCSLVRVGITGVTSAAYRAHGVENALAGAEPTDEALAHAAAAAADGVDANSDIHASAEYRSHLAGVLARRALALARDRATASRRRRRRVSQA